jgi:hypothetical protein
MTKFKFKKTHQIGSPDAETDELVLDAFIRIENIDEIIDTKNQKSILLGRTGSGKSAIIKYLKKNCENVQEIAPEAMSLRFLSNSTILRYFNSIGVNLNLFYKVLWRHVFIVELLKMYFNENDDVFRKKNFFIQLKEKVQGNDKKPNPRKEKAIKYLENWSNDFWQQTEVLIKNFELSIQNKFSEAIGVEAEILKLGLTDEKFRNENFIYEAKQKAENIISSAQVVELIDVINIMREDLFLNHQKKFYIVIDDLDKDWIEDSIRLDLIGAMIDVIKELRQLNGVKIVISLRENLNEIVFTKHEHKGLQREKLKPLYSNLEWSTDELKKLIDSRIQIVTDKEFNLRRIFDETRRGNKKGFDYVLERTFYRPRDVISFINHILENISNKNYITNDIISKAEPSYSLERFQALEDEWMENYGRISLICDFLRGINNGFKIKSVNENLFTEIYCDDEIHKNLNGELKIALMDWKNDKINFTSFLKKLLYILYRIGVIGVKKGPSFPIMYYYSKEVLIERNDISNNSRFYVHPSLYSFFKVNTLEQLPEY